MVPSLVFAQNTSLWSIISNNLKPVVNSWGLQVPSLGSTGNPCVSVGTTGVFATTTCGSGGGGTSTPSVGSSGWVQFASTTAGYFDAIKNYFFDKTNQRLGIQVSDTPQNALHVAGTIGDTISAPTSGTSTLLSETLPTAPTGSITKIAEPSAGTGGGVNFTNQGSGSFYANGTTYCFRIYPTLVAGGIYYKSQYYESVTNTDPNDSDYYDINVSWGTVSISGETVQYFIEGSSDCSSYNAIGVFSGTGATITSLSGSDSTTPWPTYYTAGITSGPDAPVSFDSMYEDTGYSGFYESGTYYQYEIDTYKVISGDKYVSGTPVTYSAYDNNMGSYFAWSLSWTLTGSYDGVIIRRSTDGGSSWSYNDLGSVSSYLDDNFSDDGVSSSRWGVTYSGGGSTTYTFNPYGIGTSPSSATVYSTVGTQYSTTISTAGNFILKHTFSSATGKILDNTFSYGYQFSGSQFYDPGPTTWGFGTAVTPNSYGYTGTNQNRTYRVYSYKTSGGNTIYSSTYLTLTTTAGSGSKYVDANWTAVTGASGYKIFRSINGGAFSATSKMVAGTGFTDDSTDSAWGSSGTITPTTVLAETARFDKESTSRTDASTIALVSTGSGTRYPGIAFGVANNSSSSPTFTNYITSESSTGYLYSTANRFVVETTRGGTPSVMLGNANIINNNQSSSAHFSVRGQNDANLINTRSDQDTVGFGQAIGTDELATVQIHPARSGDAGLVLKGHSSQTDSSTLIRLQDNAGSYKGEITMGGWWRGSTGSVSTPAVSTRVDTNTGFHFPSGDTIGVVTGGTERARFNINGRFAIGSSNDVGRLDITEGTLGNSIFRFLTTATNDDPVVSVHQNRTTTTSAATTTLQTFSVATNNTVTIEARVLARRTGGSSGTTGDSAAYTIEGTFKNISGTVTQVGSQTTVHQAEDQSAWNTLFTISGTNVLVSVVGATNNNITWHLVKGELSTLNQ